MNFQIEFEFLECKDYKIGLGWNLVHPGFSFSAKTTGLNIFIAYILHAGDWATSYINIIYALSPGKYQTMS